MPAKSVLASPLKSKVVALPESRQLDVLANLFERRQAQVIRVPLIAILDTPDQATVIDWMQNFIADPPDFFIILTGEGLRRLVAVAQRQGLEEKFVQALGDAQTICRGPKPGRALNELNLKPDVLAIEPTTAGIIATLKTMELKNLSVSVQLYGEDPNLTLMEYLATCELKRCDSVAPYIYASNSDTGKVHELIKQLHEQKIDLIAFTSKSQISRLFNVAKKSNLENELKEGLARTKIAAIGPVVRDELVRYGCDVHVMPTTNYFMKPLVTAAERLYSTKKD